MARLLLASFILFVLVCSCNSRQKTESQNTCDSEIRVTTQSDIPPKALSLIEAYPLLHLSYKHNRVYFEDGSSLLFDDGMDKDFVTKLEHTDIEDMFSTKYESLQNPVYLSDAGRLRCDSLFMKIYGSNKAEVVKKLVTIDWFDQKIEVTSVNEVDKKLCMVRDEIAKYPELKEYVNNSSTFYWRYVRGSETRLSAHSYGIAIDINTSFSDYWLWDNPDASEMDEIEYRNKIPYQIVQIFEKYGFIWGGSWYHYDTMHFEYRPEILVYSSLSLQQSCQ